MPAVTERSIVARCHRSDTKDEINTPEETASSSHQSNLTARGRATPANENISTIKPKISNPARKGTVKLTSGVFI